MSAYFGHFDVADVVQFNRLRHHGAQFKNCGRDVAFQEKTKISKIKNCFFSKLSAFFDVIDVLFIKIIIKFN